MVVNFRSSCKVLIKTFDSEKARTPSVEILESILVTLLIFFSNLCTIARNACVPSFPELPKPPERVFMERAEARFARLRWPPSVSKDVESYTILVRRQDADRDAPPRQIPNIARPSRPKAASVHYTVTGLEPNTRYEMRVMAISKIGHSHPSEPAYFKTSELRESDGRAGRGHVVMIR